jgi:uncharacterized protein YqgC (DUF456 family)
VVTCADHEKAGPTGFAGHGRGDVRLVSGAAAHHDIGVAPAPAGQSFGEQAVALGVGGVGVLIGPFVGAVLGELSVRRGLGAAGRAGFGATVGLVLGTAVKLAIGFAMIGIAVVVRVF